MPLKVAVAQGTYDFNGPFTSVAGLLQSSGVYVISTIKDGLHYVIDVGESQNVQHRVNTHDRASSWGNHISNGLYVSAIYCNEQSRMLVEKTIRTFHNPPCGECQVPQISDTFVNAS